MRSAPIEVAGAVAGNDFGVVWQGEQAGVDGVDDLLGVAAGQVGAADAPGEEGVSGEDHLERREMKADRALGVAGRVEDVCGVVVEAYATAVGEGFVGWCEFREWERQPTQPVQP